MTKIKKTAKKPIAFTMKTRLFCIFEFSAQPAIHSMRQYRIRRTGALLGVLALLSQTLVIFAPVLHSPANPLAGFNTSFLLCSTASQPAQLQAALERLLAAIDLDTPNTPPPKQLVDHCWLCKLQQAEAMLLQATAFSLIGQIILLRSPVFLNLPLFDDRYRPSAPRGPPSLV